MQAMKIKRDFYLNRLIEAKGDGFVKIVTGIRRCGKSYLLSSAMVPGAVPVSR